MMPNNNYKLFICFFMSILILFVIYLTFNGQRDSPRMDTVIPRFSFYNRVEDADLDDTIESSQNYLRKFFHRSEDSLETHWLSIIKHYIPVPLESSYGSHKLVLLAASILTSEHRGPVVEMGCGYHSTLLLHQILVNEQKRYLLSTDTDKEWLGKFQTNLTSDLHEFRHISQTSEWDEIGNDRARWSIVFVDHKPGERRVVDIIRLENVTDVMIIHDTEAPGYNYEQGLSRFPYRYRYKYLSTNTDVVSKYNGTLFQNIRYLLELTIKMQLPKQ